MLKKLFCIYYILSIHQILPIQTLTEQLQKHGFLEIYTYPIDTTKFQDLYDSFDSCIDFLKKNPIWIKKLSIAKERFIRSYDKNYYSTNTFGLYDESQEHQRGHISFYYAIDFHTFIVSQYPEFNDIPEIMIFLNKCLEIQKPYYDLYRNLADELNLPLTDFPILLKIILYLPSYTTTKPHYDGTAFSFFLHSTDDQSLLFAPYQSLLTVDNFSSLTEKISAQKNRTSIVIIPGAHLTDFSIYPTPHIVKPTGQYRYATIAFALRSNYRIENTNFAALPQFKH